MKEIKELVENINEELEDAEKYARLAVMYKSEDSRLADTYVRLANEELNHSELLHGQAVRIIEAYKAAGQTAPPAMMAVWEWEHKKSIDHKAKVKSMIDMYKS
jgi:ferritin